MRLLRIKRINMKAREQVEQIKQQFLKDILARYVCWNTTEDMTMHQL